MVGNQGATSVDEQGVDIAKAILDEDPSIAQKVNQELATAVASSGSGAASATSTSSRRMTPAGMRARRYPVGRYVVSGKEFKNDDN